jgi:hypothetical protein
MIIKILPASDSGPSGKLADAEIHFADGPFQGLKLIGFSIWTRRTGGHNVTFPARQYTVNGERRSFALLRPGSGDASAQDAVRDAIIAAYQATEEDDARQNALLTSAMRNGGPGITAPTTTKDEPPCAPSSVGFSF